MRLKSRIDKLRNKISGHDRIIFINASTSHDFRAQIRAHIEGGLDPEGKKFVYMDDPLQSLYESIKRVSGPLVKDPARHFSKDKDAEAGHSNTDVPKEER